MIALKAEEKNKLVGEIWEEISQEWHAVDIPLYKREKLDVELERCINAQGRISLRALRKYSYSWEFSN